MQKNVLAVVIHGLHDHEPRYTKSLVAQVEQRFPALGNGDINIHWLPIHWAWISECQPADDDITSDLSSIMDDTFLEVLSASSSNDNEPNAINQLSPRKYKRIQRVVEARIIDAIKQSGQTLSYHTPTAIYALCNGRTYSSDIFWQMQRRFSNVVSFASATFTRESRSANDGHLPNKHLL